MIITDQPSLNTLVAANSIPTTFPIPTEGRLILPRSVRQMTIFFPKTSMQRNAYVKHYRLDQPENTQQATDLE